CEPRSCAVGVHRDVDGAGFDRVDVPALSERDDDLVTMNSPWTPVAGLLVAEAQHEVAPAWHDHRGEASLVPRAVGVLENVEQTTTDPGVDPLSVSSQLECVHDHEANR